MHMYNKFISSTATVDESVTIGNGCKIWHGSQIRENVQLGQNVIIGSNVYLGPGVRIGSNSKIQNNAQIYEPAIIHDGVFIGPGVIFTNDRNPRAVNPDKSQKNPSDWEQVGVIVGEGASIGAGAVCVGQAEIGMWSLVGAGSIVVSNIPNFALVVGIPARQIGWVGKAGVRLIEKNSETFFCPKSETIYRLIGKILKEVVV